ncbi:hypothetical protein [uncultured Roseibium sp.]|uniref:hypothetical protein n=1 Tax=uncultured Roseibium sp. TaxID=1936171 RepID=UPI00261F9CE8|nr:hypothetical protein [uncultured Roseibium sp.]
MRSVAVILALLTISCDREATEDGASPCFDQDVLKEYQNPEIALQNKMLMLRQSGFQDKIFILEIYPIDTTFDHCNRGSHEPLAQQVVNPQEGVLQSIILQGEDIKLIQKKNEPASELPITDVPIQILHE